MGAVDGGRPSLTGTLTVDVKISDINDNPPVFDQEFYMVDVPEDKAIGQTVQQVSDIIHLRSGMSNLAAKLGQIGPKWDKSGTF